MKPSSCETASRPPMYRNSRLLGAESMSFVTMPALPRLTHF